MRRKRTVKKTVQFYAANFRTKLRRASQAMRFVVIDRHITQGTRGVRGQQICERLWTVMATCSLHKRSAFQWIHQAIRACFKGAKVPSLIADSS